MLQGLWMTWGYTEFEENDGLEETWLCAHSLLIKFHVRAQEPYVTEGETKHMRIIGEWVCVFEKVYVFVHSMPVLNSYSSGHILHITMQLFLLWWVGGFRKKAESNLILNYLLYLEAFPGSWISIIFILKLMCCEVSYKMATLRKKIKMFWK